MTVIALTEVPQDETRKDNRGNPIKKSLEYVFDNWTDFVDTAEGRVATRGNSECSSRKWGSGGSGSFYTSDTFEDSIKLARNGWPEGTKRIAGYLEKLQGILPAKQFKKELAYSMVGPGTVDIGRFMIGHPECVVAWQDVDDDQGNGPIVSITYNLGTSGSIGKDTMFQRGAMIAALIDLLERANRRCELTLIANHPRNGYEVRYKVMVKRANDPLDIERIAYALCNGDCYRRLGFSLLEGAPENYIKACQLYNGGGYGTVGVWNIPDTLLVPGLDSYILNNEDRQIEWLKGQLKQQGVEWD